MKTLTPDRQNNSQERAFYWVAPEALEQLAEEIAEGNQRRAALRNSLLQLPSVPAVALPEASLEQLRASNRAFLEKRRQPAHAPSSLPTSPWRQNRTAWVVVIAIGLLSTLATIATTVPF